MRQIQLFIAPFVLFTGCIGAVQGSGVVIEDERDVDAFSAVLVSGDLDVDIVVGRSRKVVLRLDDNLVDFIKTETVDGRLEVTQHQDISFYDTTEQSLRIEVPSLVAYEGTGETTATILGVKSGRFDAVLSESATVEIDGVVTALDVSSSGSVQMAASGLEALDVSIAASGDSELRVFASRSIRGSLSGSSKLTVYGDPDSERITTSGSAAVDYR